MGLEQQPSTINIPRCKIERWLGWAPGLDTVELWEQWAKGEESVLLDEGQDPPITFLPIAMRKKLSTVTKISLWLAHNILTEQERSEIPTVFSSRHGEGLLTIELLDEIQRGETLSPMSFSRSVHNAASGLFGIAYKNRAPSTALAGMEKSFEMGLIEAAAQLDKHERVLYVMADEKLPKDFRNYVDESWGAYGVALLLGRGESELKLQESNKFPSAVSFLREYIQGGCER